MTTLSTHDTKRSEDARARLAVLSEVPAEWDAAVRGWHAASAPLRSPLLDGPTEYLVWQTLVATWDHADDRPLAEERLQQYLTKAVREAKLRTTWTAVDEPYEEAVAAFATGVLGARPSWSTASGRSCARPPTWPGSRCWGRSWCS